MAENDRAVAKDSASRNLQGWRWVFTFAGRLGPKRVEQAGSMQIKTLHEALDQKISSKERLCSFVQMTFDNRETLARSGCPTGTLCTELHKNDGSLVKRSTMLSEQLLGWFETQFEALGKGGESQGLAVHLLSALQGIAFLAHSLSNPEIVVMETERLQRWICTVGTKSAREA
jgi:TetR/AcrR family transcriptional regulator, transcriptional repressor for nem operon